MPLSPRDERWVVVKLYYLRQFSPVCPPAQVISVKNSVKRSAEGGGQKFRENPKSHCWYNNGHGPERHNLRHVMGRILVGLALVPMGHDWENCNIYVRPLTVPLQRVEV